MLCAGSDGSFGARYSVRDVKGLGDIPQHGNKLFRAIDRAHGGAVPVVHPAYIALEKADVRDASL